MADFTDLSHLPKAERRTEGEPPDKESRFGRVLPDQWYAERLEEEATKVYRDLRFYFSNAGACSRAVAYAALGMPESNHVDPESNFIMRLGTELHRAWQDAARKKWPEAEIEVQLGDDDGGVMGGRGDSGFTAGVVTDKRIMVEYKSVGGYAYKLAVGGMGPPKGPSYSHKLQGFLNGRAWGADEVVISYAARDAFNAAIAKGLEPMARVTAEWTYPREMYEPIADKEIERVNAILALVDEGTLPRRKIPDPEYPSGHIVRNPKARDGKGEWVEIDGDDHVVNAGSAWQCAYCRYQDTCARTGSHRESVDVLVKIGALDEEALHGGRGDPRGRGQHRGA